MNIKSIVAGLALIVLGAWCLYRGIKNWKDRTDYPALRYVAWGIFAILMGVIAMILGYLGWWVSY